MKIYSIIVLLTTAASIAVATPSRLKLEARAGALPAMLQWTDLPEICGEDDTCEFVCA